MNKRIKKKFKKKGSILIQQLCIIGRIMENGPHWRPPIGYEIDMKAIRRYRRDQVRSYRILNLSKATKGD